MSQVDCQEFIELAKAAGKFYTWDIEATGLHCDYNSILCVSIKPFGADPITLSVKQPGNDQKLVREVRDVLNEAAIWATFYGKMFDVKMVNGRLMKWGLPPLDRKHHIDLYFQMKDKVNTSRKSLAHIARWLQIPEKKMDMDPDEWNLILYKTKIHMPVLNTRCESDVTSLEQATMRVQHVFRDVTR